MLIATGLQRDHSQAGRLLGLTNVYVFDTETGTLTTYAEELPHRMRIAQRGSGGLESSVRAAMDEVRDKLASWAEKRAEAVMRGHTKPDTKAYKAAAERAAGFTRYAEHAHELVTVATREEADGTTITIDAPAVEHRRFAPLTRLVSGRAQRDELLGSSNRSARAIIPPYSVVVPRTYLEGARRRTLEVVGRIETAEARALPRFTYDLEVTDYLPLPGPDLSGASRERILETLDALAEEAGYVFDRGPFEHMDAGELRQHARLFTDLRRNERIYDAAVRLPSGAIHDVTSLKGTNETFEADDGRTVRVHRVAEQQQILDRVAELAASEPWLIASGHNQIGYDGAQVVALGGYLALGADGTEIRTRFAVAGSTPHKLLLPDGTQIKERHRAFLSDRVFPGRDALDPAPWIRYVDELPNAKLATIARLVGRIAEAAKIYTHEELEALAQAANASPDEAERILTAAGLEERIEDLLAREQRYAANDVIYPKAIGDRILSVVYPIARIFGATLSEVCTTSPEKHALDAWTSFREGRGAPKHDRIEDIEYTGWRTRDEFTAQDAHPYADAGTRALGVRDVIVARRSENLPLTRYVDHPALDELVELVSDLEGYERAWAMRYLDAMMSEPLYSALATRELDTRLSDHAWRLRQDPRRLAALAEAFHAQPQEVGALRASRKYLLFEDTREGLDALRAAERAGLAFEVDRGVALVLPPRGYAFRGESELLSGFADPKSLRGNRTPFTQAPLETMIDAVLDQDPERALETLRDAYERFEALPDDDPSLARSAVLGKDAVEYSSRATGALIERARELDLRRGDRVTVPFDRDEMREIVFGIPQDPPDNPLFLPMWKRKPKRRGILSGIAQAAFGADSRVDYPLWHRLVHYTLGLDERARGELLAGFEAHRHG